MDWKELLSQLQTGDIGATPPDCWWKKLLCRIVKAKTFHWFMFVREDKDGWIVSESIGKGTAITRFDRPRAYIYRIKDIKIDLDQIISIHSHYGEWSYDWDVPFKTALWWFLKHYFGVIIPRWKDKEVNCQEWVCLLACELGVKIIPDNEYPMCTNLEHSPYLNLVAHWQGEE